MSFKQPVFEPSLLKMEKLDSGTIFAPNKQVSFYKGKGRMFSDQCSPNHFYDKFAAFVVGQWIMLVHGRYLHKSFSAIKLDEEEYTTSVLTWVTTMIIVMMMLQANQSEIFWRNRAHLFVHDQIMKIICPCVLAYKSNSIVHMQYSRVAFER